MLLRIRRLNPIDSAIGAVYQTNPPAGGNPPGGATGDPPPAPPASGAGGTPPPDVDRSSWIPRQRFDEVNGELQKFRDAEARRQTDEAAKAGDFDTARQKLEAERDAEKARVKAEQDRSTRIARRSAFVAAASGSVSNVEAAYKLAAADGVLDAIDVDDEGEPKDAKAVEKIVTDLVKKYEFLKGGSRSFGQPSDGNGGSAPPPDTSKMTAREMMAAGYAQLGDPRTRR